MRFLSTETGEMRFSVKTGEICFSMREICLSIETGGDWSL